MDDLPNHAEAVCITFGLMYNLHLDDPRKMRNTFDLIQRVMLNLGVSNLRPKELGKCPFAVGCFELLDFLNTLNCYMM